MRYHVYLGARVLGRRIVIVLAVMSLASVVASARDLAVVSNKSNSVEEMTVADLTKICKGQTNHWADGKPVAFVMMAPAAPEMKTVAQKLYEATPVEIDALINTANHERKNHPAIVVVNSPEEVVQKVASTPGAIGVVDVYSITSAVTVVKIGGKLPLQPGYALHGN